MTPGSHLPTFDAALQGYRGRGPRYILDPNTAPVVLWAPFSGLAAPLSVGEYQGLRESIRARGLVYSLQARYLGHATVSLFGEPTEVVFGEIIDGAHRARALVELQAEGADLPPALDQIEWREYDDWDDARCAALASDLNAARILPPLPQHARGLRAQGLSVRAIAEKLRVPPSTVWRALH